MGTKYKHVFFDLDHTLWDTDRNSEEALIELYEELNLLSHGFPNFQNFLGCYRSHNERLWGLYAENKVGRDAVRINRFRHTMADFNINNFELATLLSEEFIKRTPYKKHLIKNTIEILNYISGKYPVSIITNGFKESQDIKLTNSGLKDYFSHIFISEEIGFNKPDARIFEHALITTATDFNEAIMIGDTYETDIIGAKAAGIDQVYFSSTFLPGKESTYKITDLSELTGII